jgi:ATPase subunit of ABC transporter with duplicated ATPase domains
VAQVNALQETEALLLLAEAGFTTWTNESHAVTHYDGLLTNVVKLISLARAQSSEELAQARAEIARLNKWADGFSDAQIKERQTGEAYQQELRERARSAERKCRELEAAIKEIVGDCAVPLEVLYCERQENPNPLIAPSLYESIEKAVFSLRGWVHLAASPTGGTE